MYSKFFLFFICFLRCWESRALLESHIISHYLILSVLFAPRMNHQFTWNHLLEIMPHSCYTACMHFHLFPSLLRYRKGVTGVPHKCSDNSIGSVETIMHINRMWWLTHCPLNIDLCGVASMSSYNDGRWNYKATFHHHFKLIQAFEHYFVGNWITSYWFEIILRISVALVNWIKKEILDSILLLFLFKILQLVSQQVQFLLSLRNMYKKTKSSTAKSRLITISSTSESCYTFHSKQSSPYENIRFRGKKRKCM